MKLATAVLATTLAATAHASPCPPLQAASHILTPDGTTLPADGNVVIETRYIRHKGAEDDTARMLVDGKIGGKTVLVGGTLAVLTPPAGGDVVLIDRQDKPLRTYKRGAAVAQLAAPKLRAITATVPVKTEAARRGYGGPVSTTKVVLAGAAPADAVALVLWTGKDTDASGYYLVDGTTYEHTTGSRTCSPPVGGAFDASIGDAVTAAWLDKWGRFSPRSKVTVVRKAKAR